MKKRRAILLILLATPTVALANPSPVAGPYGPFLGLLAEAVIIAIVLGRKGFDPLRFFYGWAGVTCATFLMLFGGFYAVDRLLPLIPFGGGIALFFLAEAAIVVIEAAVLSRMTHLRFFQGKRKTPLGFSEALPLSLIVNVTSFLFSV